jgi:uncharacterized membrane protein
MTSDLVFLLAIGIGIVAGLRSLTAPAVVAWGAHLGRLDLAGSAVGFMGSKVAVAIFTLLALAEFVGDLLTRTPSRTSAGPLVARILMGGLCGACVCLSFGQSLIGGAVLGAIGGVIGAFAGYQGRMRLVRALGVKDFFIAIPEDLVAIGLAYLIVFVA